MNQLKIADISCCQEVLLEGNQIIGGINLSPKAYAAVAYDVAYGVNLKNKAAAGAAASAFAVGINTPVKVTARAKVDV